MTRIFTDMCSDLPEQLAKRYDISVIPMTYTLGGRDRVLSYQNNDPAGFYAQMRAGAMLKTSQINSETFINEFLPVLKAGDDIMYLAFSSALSGTYNSARIAAEQLAVDFPERTVCIIDTKCASMGQALLVYLAAKKLEQCSDLAQTRSYVYDTIPSLNHWFTVDDLHHLHRGGRVSKSTAILGTLLSIKPVLHVDDEGRLIAVSKVKGRKKALTAIADRLEEQGMDIDSQEIFISHGDAPEDAAFLRDLILQKHPGCRITVDYIGPVIGAHSGPGTVALFFLGSKR